MSNAPDDRLRRLLGGDDLTAVRQRLRRLFERAEPDALPQSIRLGGLDPAAHAALCQATGRRSRTARSIVLDIVELDARLRAAGLAGSLRDALEQLDGVIVPKAQLRRDLQARWSALVASAGHGQLLRAWLDDAPTSVALLKRLARDPERAAHLLADADAVLRRLPADGLTRSQLAADALGDAHALDAGRPVATLALTAWRHHAHIAASMDDPDDDAAGEKPEADPSVAERRRATWAQAGVMVSELARPALFLNLPLPVHGPVSWVPGEPGYLSLRQLLRRPIAWPVAGRRIFICENPDIVAIAADRLGGTCAPLVCTDGMPAAAQRILFDQLLAAGAHLHYHGDYDWPGIGIGNYFMRTWDARPWRFGVADYLAAVACTPPRPSDLSGVSVDALWDFGLAPAMRERGMAIAEEAVVACLLEDLGQAVVA